MSKEQRRADALDYMKALGNAPRPKAVPADETCQMYFKNVVIPSIRDSALSELRRTNQFSPKMIGFNAEDNRPMPFDIGAVFPQWGDGRSKDATAKVLFTGAMIEGVRANVFVVETWTLSTTPKDGNATLTPEQIEEASKHSIAEHPDRDEALMINMCMFDRKAYTMMQLLGMCRMIKVLGHNTSPASWKHTTLEEPDIIDPMGGPSEETKTTMKGRFIAGDDDE